MTMKLLYAKKVRRSNMANTNFQRRQFRVRANLKRVSCVDTARLSVFRSNTHIYAQIINDVKGHTLVAASSLDKTIKEKFKNGGSVEAADAVGLLLAELAKKAGIQKVVFDRGGYIYHGRVKALATGARSGGLIF
jgi:large subunit ribosomal protein L18